MLRKIFKRLFSPTLQFVAKIYSSYSHEYRFQNLRMTILPTVFHPAWYLSTHCLIDYLGEKDLKDKYLWELGAGSGLVSLFAAQKGATVVATDINPVAVEGIKRNAIRNKLMIRAFESDIFSEMEDTHFFDYIVINPPYYPQNPKNDTQKAFFCGKEFQYFHRLFQGLQQYFVNSPIETEIIMILSEDCNIIEIEKIAQQNALTMAKIWQRKVVGEWNFIFLLKHSYIK